MTALGQVLLLCIAGCGGSTNGENTGGAGTGGSYAAFNAGTGGSGKPCGWGGCLAPRVTFDVSAAADAGVPNSVEAALSGPTPATLSCEPVGTIFECLWPSNDIAEGDYSLSVTAPGFQTVNVGVTVTKVIGSCGCESITVDPSAVILEPT